MLQEILNSSINQRNFRLRGCEIIDRVMRALRGEEEPRIDLREALNRIGQQIEQNRQENLNNNDDNKIKLNMGQIKIYKI